LAGNKQELMGIGEFAAMSWLSPRALRLYDELGLLPPTRVDPDSGYRWYAAGQLQQARLVGTLRQLEIPLAQIKVILALDPAAASSQVADCWARAESAHAARRELANFLIDRLNGKETVMPDIQLRDMPARSMLCVLHHASAAEHMAVGKDMLKRLRPVAPPRPNDPVTAPFSVFYGEVNEDSDGPIEFCWPVPEDQAAEIAARFPDLTLRTEPAHQEAFVNLGQSQPDAARLVPVLEGLVAWISKQQRQPTGGLRNILLSNPEAGERGPDSEWALALRPINSAATA
jgi:DNA-binding transcriptional MerR regulator